MRGQHEWESDFVMMKKKRLMLLNYKTDFRDGSSRTDKQHPNRLMILSSAAEGHHCNES